MMSAAYSLLELIFSMAILFILISAATISPSMIVLEYRLDHYAQNLINSLRLARSKALHQVETVSLCPSKDGIICTKEQYELGWILFHDHQLPRGQREQSKEALIWRQSALASGYSLRANGNAADAVSFYASGRNSTGIGASFYLCFSDNVRQAHVLSLNSRGRLRRLEHDPQGIPLKSNKKPIANCLLE